MPSQKFQFNLSTLLMATVVAAQLFAAVRWFGIGSLDALVAIFFVVPVLVPFALRAASVQMIKWWLKAAVIVSAVSLLISVFLSLGYPLEFGLFNFALAIWTSLVLWWYWGYREFRGLYSLSYRERNMNGSNFDN